MESFIEIHRLQFELMGLPQHLYNTVAKKVKEQIYDCGSFFSFAEVDYEGELEISSIDEEVTYHSDMKYNLVSTSSIKGESDIFLIDHMWYGLSIIIQRSSD